MPIQMLTYTRGTTIVSPVYLDANFPISCFFRGHAKYVAARNFLFELFAQQVEIYISTLMVDEVWWGLLREWYRDDTGIQITARRIKMNPNILNRYHHRFQQITSNMLNWVNTTFLPTNTIGAKNTIQCALRFLTQNNIQPRDSFHLALIALSGAAGFITSDSDFDNITIPGTNLTIYKY